MTVEELIKKSELAMDQQGQRMINVGNGPHYPMLILYNDDFSEEDLEVFSAKLDRIWPQTLDRLVQYSYTAEVSGEITLFSVSDRREVSVEEVTRSLDQAKMARDIFRSMKQWCLYNVVSTRSFTSVDEFIAHYQAQEQCRKIVVDQVKSMLIVLLEDSILRRSIAGEIRNYLAKHSQYDSTILIATRSRSNEMYAVEELYRIAADVLLISNNDAVSAWDDSGYKKRVSTLYNGGTYTVSYTLVERPTRKIATQMQGALLRNMAEQLKPPARMDLNDWNKGFAFDRFKSPVCERFISNQRLRIDRELFESLPLRQKALRERVSLASMAYAKAKEYTFEDAFSGLVESCCQEQFRSNSEISSCVKEFRAETVKRFPATMLRQLTDSMIKQIIGQLFVGASDEGLPLPEYFESQLHICLRRDYIYPRFAQALRELRDSAEETVKGAEEVRADYQKAVPAGYFDGVGTMYEKAAVNYLHGERGQRQLAEILSAENGRDGVLEQMLACFRDMLRHNEELFSLSFTEEWRCRLDLTGDRIYHEISSVLTNGADDAIRLYGNYPLDKRMKVYLLHATDAAGKNPTQLYTSLRETFAGDDTAQYFNTGCDNALEAITFVACEGKNLLLF